MKKKKSVKVMHIFNSSAAVTQAGSRVKAD